MIVGRTGHMEDGKYVADSVTVKVEMPGGWAVYANDVTEAKARKRGEEVIEKAKDEMRKQIIDRQVAGMMKPEDAERLKKEAHL